MPVASHCLLAPAPGPGVASNVMPGSRSFVRRPTARGEAAEMENYFPDFRTQPIEKSRSATLNGNKRKQPETSGGQTEARA